MQLGTKKGTLYESTIRITSSDRIPGTQYSSSNFVFDAGQNLQMVRKVSVVSASFFNNFNNITAPNNTFLLILSHPSSVNTYTISVTPGRYTFSQLASAIEAAIATISSPPNIVISFNSSGTSYMANISFTSDAVNLAATFVYPTYPGPASDNPTSLLFYLGYSFDHNFTLFPTLFGTLSASAPYVPKLFGPPEIFINSQVLFPSNTTDEQGRYSNSGIAIPVTAPYLGLNTWECKVDSLCSREYGRSRRLNQIDVQIMDRKNNILDMSDGEFTMILKVWFNEY